jgi:signal transduction histidine kinase/CheY-like chemotaxis protein
MLCPALPLNEPIRLKALHELYILDTPPEERFDRLTRIARKTFGVPMAFINLVDADRQWCKSSLELNVSNTPRSISFCGHTILETEPLVVYDTLEDPRFLDNPLVIDGPRFRSYLGVPLFSDDGQCVGAFCILDLKPRRFSPVEIEILKDLAAAAQSELTNVQLNKSLEVSRLALENAETAMKSKQDFLAMVSHEIRTPMNGILGMAEILADSELTDSQRGSLDTIRECTHALVSLMNDVLDFSKIESGRLDLEKIPFDPRVSINHVIALNHQAAARKGVVLESRVGPKVPVTILGDPLRIGQILLNLVGNAVKFTRSGSVKIDLDVAARGPTENPLLRFEVRDTGVGISPEARARLFQAFRQADPSVARHYGGTGLGLVISKQLVERMGGEITVESAPAQGSTFSFTIAYPLGESTAAAPVVVAPAQRALQASSALTVLVAEDNLVNQRVLAHLLKKIGYSAEFVSGGFECLKRLARESFDIVLMDVQMPDLDGMETARRLRALSGHATSPWIIAVTANAMPEDRQRCLSAGMNDYLSKPLREESLRAAFARAAARPET